MKLSEVSIRRPVLASMISAALVLFGFIGYTRLSVRELPDIDPPVISVTTVLPGANAQVVETAVTDVLEEELSTIQGIRTMSSTSSEQTSNITLEFTLDRPVDVAAQDVRDKVSRVRGRLPVDVLEPVIAKQSADAQPFFWLALSSDNYDLMQLSDVADRLVKARLQSLPGVGSAAIFGERRYSMRVWIKPEALSARGLAVQDIENAIVSRNVEIPAGRNLDVARDDCVFDVLHREPARRQRLRLDPDAHRVAPLAEDGRAADARQTLQPRLHQPVRDVGQLHQVVVVARQREPEERLCVGRLLGDHRLEHVDRQAPADARHLVAHVLRRHVHRPVE